MVELAPTALPLGLFRDARFETRRFELSEGDTVFLYSDGVSETRDRSGRPYGSERLASVLVAAGVEAGVEAVLRSFADDLDDFRDGGTQDDDVTLLAVRRRAGL